jgi:hypothetical protein
VISNIDRQRAQQPHRDGAALDGRKTMSARRCAFNR